MKKLFLIVAIAVVCAFADSAKAQNSDLRLSGRTSEISIQSYIYQFRVTVLDPEKEPIVGALIMCNGSGGTITDLDGEAVIASSKDPASLVISCVGYKTVKIKVSGTHSIAVVMEPEENLLD